MMQVDKELIFMALKKQLRKRGVSYLALADRLGATESAIKNMFYSKSITLDRLLAVCEAIDLGFADLVKAAELTTLKDFEFSEEAEAFFLDNPHHLHFFRELVLHRKPPAKIKKEHGLDDRSLFLYLRTLEKFGLIEVLSDSNIRYKVQGRLQWRINGPWVKKRFPQALQDHLHSYLADSSNKNRYLNFGAFSLPEKELQHFYREIDSVVEKYKSSALSRSMSSASSDQQNEVFVGWNILINPAEHPGKQERLPRL